jgi:hypothetical protein
MTPDSTVPSDVAAFSEKWSGRWEGVLDSTLVVTKIYPNKKGGWRADVVYSWGTYSGWRIDRAGYREYEADFKDGALVVQSGRLVITYRLSDDRGSLAGTWNAMRGDYKGTFVRAASQ